MAELKISSDLQNIIKKVVLDTYFPVGSLYLTVGSENPNNTIGGTWSKISGYYLYADTSINNTSYTGKHTQSHKLTQQQMPTTVPVVRGNITTSEWSCGVWHNYGYGGYGINLPGQYGSGGQGEAHLHNIATKGIYVWQRTS